MNLDEVFGLSESMPLVSTNPFMLLICILCSMSLGWYSAYRYRNTYDIEKSIRTFLPGAPVLAIVFVLLKIPVLFAVGSQLFGFVSLLIFSNRFFRK